MTSGIYAIISKSSDRVYVGSSVDIPRRWSEHRDSLNQGDHHNYHLQRAWNLYGSEAFKFEEIEQCDRSDLLMKEKFWIEFLGGSSSGWGYNLVSDPTLQSVGMFPSPEVRQNMSRAQKGKTIPPEVREKMSETRTGRVVSEATREKIRRSMIGKSHPTERRVSNSEAQKKLYLEGKRSRYWGRRRDLRPEGDLGV